MNENQSIFEFVIHNLDEDEVFTPKYLPDNPHETIARSMGSTDAAVYTMNIPPNMEDAGKLINLLRSYNAEPDTPHFNTLYKALCESSMAEYCDPFIASFSDEDMKGCTYDLAYDLFYNAHHREPVKFAILLFGLYGMQLIKENAPKTWSDLVRIAHCEEFTFPFLYCCRMNGFQPQKEIWELLGATKGWGKVFCIIDCATHNDAERRWLLLHGPEIDVQYPPLSFKLIQATQLDTFLRSTPKPLDHELFKSAVAIIGNYLVMLCDFKPKDITDQFNIKAVNLYSLVEILLDHAQYLVEKTSNPEYVLDVINIAISLRRLREEQKYLQLTPNQCEELIGTCDAITYAHDWSEEIAKGLIVDDEINLTLCDLAYEMELDIWPKLYSYWLQHAERTDLFPYLLSYEEDNRAERVIKQITLLLPQYRAIEEALLTPMHYLANHEGQGEAIFIDALTGMYDLPRGVACGALGVWDHKYISPALKDALTKARFMTENQLILARIDSLLAGKEFTIEEYLDSTN